MSMKNASDRITICEVLRRINDRHQSNSEHDVGTRRLLAVCEQMAKKMSHKMLIYNHQWEPEFYRKNPNYAETLAKRHRQPYVAYRLSDQDRKEFKL